MRFALIDRILRFHRAEGIRAVKTLSQAEEYLMDHFPGYPVLPGVLMIEAMTQAAAWHLRVVEDFRHPIVTLEETSHVRFGHFVTPGDSLVVDLQLRKRDVDGSRSTFRGKGYILAAGATAGDDPRSLPMACQARLTVRGSPVSAVAPELAPDMAAYTEEQLRRGLRRELVSLGFSAAAPGDPESTASVAGEGKSP
jgi:3-hydroxymyristoyl/3-hydroxydecanoyl-(acyl carrier protein) dehydratase